MGNWDSYFARGFPEPSGEVGERLLELGAWWSAQLSPADREYLDGLEPFVELPLGDGRNLLAFHGSPRSCEDWILPTTPDDELDEMLGERRAPIMAGGHTHFQLVRRLGGILFVNPGAWGSRSRGRRRCAHCPWAEYAIVDARERRLSIEVRRTGYDVGRTSTTCGEAECRTPTGGRACGPTRSRAST